MGKSGIRRRWIYVLIFFVFMFLHQFDVVLLGPILSQIMETFNISTNRLQPLINAGLIVGAVFFFIWGRFYDTYSRKRLLALAGFIWGATSLLMGIAPTYATFAISYAASAVDNASYSGIFSLISDYFTPRNRGKIIGLLLATQPIAFLYGIVLTNILSFTGNWRIILLVVSTVAFIMAFVVLFGVKDPKRGQSEPALRSMHISGKYLFDWEIAIDMLRKPGLILLYGLGFFAIIPWTAITIYIFPYLSNVRGIALADIYMILIPSLIALALGYPIGGMLGDLFFKIKKRGRVLVNLIGITLAIIFLSSAFQVADEQGMAFLILMTFTGLFMALEKPNVIAMVFDTTLPELRSTAMAFMMFCQLIGSMIGPLAVGALIPRIGSGSAILWVCVVAWGISLLLLIGLLFLMPKDIENLRKHMAYRSQLEARLESRK